MTINTEKISELTELSTLSEGGMLPIAVAKEKSTTFKATVSSLRSTIMFEDASETIAAGLNSTVNGETFFVYTDSSKEYVKGWVNNGQSAAAAVDAYGEQLYYGTFALLLNTGKYTKAVVQVETLAALRLFSPAFNGQTVLLKRAVPNGPIIDELLTYDAVDTLTPDDDLTVFVSLNRYRFKVDYSKGYNVFLAGFDPSLNNLSACVNKVNALFVSRAVAKKQIITSKLTVLVPGYGNDNTFYCTETMRFSGSLICLSPMTSMIFDFTAIGDGDAIVISNEYTGLNSGMGNSINGSSADQGGYAINPNGVLFIRGPGIKTSTGSDGSIAYEPVGIGTGLVLGNRTKQTDGSAWLNVRDTVVKNIRVFGFNYGLTFGHNDFYNSGLEDFNLYGNIYNVYQGVGTSSNSGERIWMRNGTISNSYLDCFYLNSTGHDYYLHNCSVDYAKRDAIRIGPIASFSMFINQCHFEGMDQLMINQPIKTSTGGQCRFLMTDGKVVPVRYGVTYRGIRQLFNASNYNAVIVELFNVDMNSGPAGYMANDAYGSWTGLDNLCQLTIKHRNSDIYKWIPGTRYGVGGYILNPIKIFTGTAAAALPTTITAATTDVTAAYHYTSVPAGGSIVYGSPGDADADGLIPIKITLANATDIAYIFSAGYTQFQRNTIKLSSMISVKCGSATGAVNVQSVLRPLTYQDITVSGSTVTQTEKNRGTVLGDTIDVLGTILAKNYLDRTTDTFVITPPLRLDNYFLGSLWGNTGFKFTGFVGTIYVKLPMYWFDNIHPNS